MSVTVVHLSDVHFGGVADLEQVEAVEAQVPELGADAVVISGDVGQRARHGEFQRARALLLGLARSTPVLLVPGNHDVQWWRSPFGLLGPAPRYAKYRRYFGAELGPVLEAPGLVVAGMVSAHGLALGSLTWNQRDLTVKGHLPRAETERAARVLGAAPAGAVRMAALHHNVLRGRLSRRMGLAHWKDAQARLDALGADVVLCGHDHEEGAGDLPRGTVISTAGTISTRSRGKRPGSFNLVTVDDGAVSVRHWRWDRPAARFVPSDEARFARRHARAGAAAGGR
ncbi:MAG TPA: metallophosphoesterase [Gemmatimonadales bacterium]|nr:metallophosphoesterase [Gemmatimonadales bacterium]